MEALKKKKGKKTPNKSSCSESLNFHLGEDTFPSPMFHIPTLTQNIIYMPLWKQLAISVMAQKNPKMFRVRA